MHLTTTLRIIVFVLFLFSINPSFAQGRRVGIIYIGDSITYGAGLDSPAKEAPPVISSAWVQKQKGLGSVQFSNQGHSGYTTLDFLPGTPALAQVLAAAKALQADNNLLVFSVMLGTNDSAVKGTHGAPVSVNDYKTNLQIITDTLLAQFPKTIVIYQRQVWYSPNTQNGATYLQEGLTRLQSYAPVFGSLVANYQNSHPGHVFMGDIKAYDYFKTNYLTDFQAEAGHQGTFYLHPNQKGAKALGRFWATAIYTVLKPIR